MGVREARAQANAVHAPKEWLDRLTAYESGALDHHQRPLDRSHNALKAKGRAPSPWSRQYLAFADRGLSGLQNQRSHHEKAPVQTALLLG